MPPPKISRRGKGRTPPKQRTSAPKAGGLRLSWRGLRPMYDYWGNEIQRYYQLETLVNSTEWYLQTRDKFILPSVRTVLGDAPLKTLTFELFQEGRYQLIFRLRAVCLTGQQAAFGFVVAKNAEEATRVARAEHHHLKALHGLAPKLVVQPYGGGTLYLPDRYGRRDRDRDIYAYLTQWHDAYHELGVDQNLQFILNITPRHTFTLAETEEIKGDIVQTIAATYDSARKSCMEMPQIASGDFVATHPGKGPIRLKLIACRGLLTKMTPAGVLDKILGASWPWGQRRFELMPAYPETLFEGLARALGPDGARAWVADYAAAVRAGRVSKRYPKYLAALTALC